VLGAHAPAPLHDPHAPQLPQAQEAPHVRERD
jgi:hypothetical protein